MYHNYFEMLLKTKRFCDNQHSNKCNCNKVHESHIKQDLKDFAYKNVLELKRNYPTFKRAYVNT